MLRVRMLGRPARGVIRVQGSPRNEGSLAAVVNATGAGLVVAGLPVTSYVQFGRTPRSVGW